MNVKLSFIVLTRERPAALARCLRSLGKPSPEVEVLVAANGEQPEVAALLAREFPWARLATVERSSRGRARNLAWKLARGDILYFLDDDAYPPAGFYARVLTAFAAWPQAPAVGGPNVLPPGSSAFQRAADAVLSSPFGAGPMSRRYRPAETAQAAPGWALMLCNLGLRRALFEALDLRFPEAAASAEENLLLFRAERLLGRPALCPELSVYHDRRESLGRFLAQARVNGLGRAQITREEPRSLLPITLAPAAGATVFAAALAGGFWKTAAGLALAYAASCLSVSLTAASRGDWSAAWRAPVLTALAHAAYLTGFLQGCLEKPRPAAHPLPAAADAAPAPR